MALLILGSWDFYTLVLLGLSSKVAWLAWVAWGRGAAPSIPWSFQMALLISVSWIAQETSIFLFFQGLSSKVAWLAWVAWGRGSTHSLSDRPGRHLAAVSLLPIVHASRL